MNHAGASAARGDGRLVIDKWFDQSAGERRKHALPVGIERDPLHHAGEFVQPDAGVILGWSEHSNPFVS